MNAQNSNVGVAASSSIEMCNFTSTKSKGEEPRDSSSVPHAIETEQQQQQQQARENHHHVSPKTSSSSTETAGNPTSPEQGRSESPSHMSNSIGSMSSTTPLSPQGLIRHWWSHNIGLTLQHTSHQLPTGHDPRDYLALERTYLAYLRTSGALVVFGVVTVQLFFLKNVGSTTGVVLGVSLYGGAIMVALVGCSRYFVQQRLLVRGKAISGGWDVMAVWVGVVVIFAAVFVVVLVED